MELKPIKSRKTATMLRYFISVILPDLKYRLKYSLTNNPIDSYVTFNILISEKYAT